MQIVTENRKKTIKKNSVITYETYYSTQYVQRMQNNGNRS